MIFIDPGQEVHEAALNSSEISGMLAEAEMAALEATGLRHVLVGIESGATVSDSRNADADWKTGGSGHNFGSNLRTICTYGLPLQVNVLGSQRIDCWTLQHRHE